jgi:hypothetical protein
VVAGRQHLYAARQSRSQHLTQRNERKRGAGDDDGFTCHIAGRSCGSARTHHY